MDVSSDKPVKLTGYFDLDNFVTGVSHADPPLPPPFAQGASARPDFASHVPSALMRDRETLYHYVLYHVRKRGLRLSKADPGRGPVPSFDGGAGPGSDIVEYIHTVTAQFLRRILERTAVVSHMRRAQAERGMPLYGAIAKRDAVDASMDPAMDIGAYMKRCVQCVDAELKLGRVVPPPALTPGNATYEKMFESAAKAELRSNMLKRQTTTTFAARALTVPRDPTPHPTNHHDVLAACRQLGLGKWHGFIRCSTVLDLAFLRGVNDM